MKTKEIKVPEGISFLSDWEGFFEAFPMNQHYILNKKICGCGATEAYLRTDKKVILASPRKHLLLDKYKQHLNDDMHLFRWNNSEDAYLSNKGSEEDLKVYKQNLFDYIKGGGRKILTTYDSIRHIKSALKGYDLNEWIVVVDEWQCVFCDCTFKPDTELNFCNELKNFPNVVFLSATPYLSEYLDKVEIFKDMTIYELQWDNARLVKPDVKAIKLCNSIENHIKEIVEEYRDGGKEFMINGSLCVSNEVVIYFNNVDGIIRAIKKSDLKPEEVNIICSSTSANKKEIVNKLGKEYKIGNIPLEGEPCKMFTFCTATVYVGADFYNRSAYTYIFANPEIDSMRIDVALDLQQILGRQRLETNPFRNMATLFYSTKHDKGIDFAECLRDKERETDEQLENYRNAPHKDVFIKLIENQSRKGEGNYCCITRDEDNNISIVKNELLAAADRRACDILDNIYRNEFTMCLELGKHNNVAKEVDNDNVKVQAFYKEWDKQRSANDKVLLYLREYNKDPDFIDECSSFIPSIYRRFIDILGEEGMKVLGYNYNDMKKAITPSTTPFFTMPKDKIGAELVKRIKENQAYSREVVRGILEEIYHILNINVKAKATDINDFLSCKETSRRIKKKKTSMLQILSYYRKDVSLFQSIRNPGNPQVYDVDKILQIISDNSYFHVKDKVEKVRSSNNDKEKSKAKLQLPAVTWNGMFNTKHTSDLRTYSSFTALDFDKIEPARMDEFGEWLKGFDCVYAYFRTPSGKGYKAIVLHDNYEPEYHYDLYTQLLKKFDCPELDTSTSDLARGNYLSYDPDLWKNPNPVPFHFIPTQKEPLRPMETYTVIKGDAGNEEKVRDNHQVTDFYNKLCRLAVPDESVINMLNKIWMNTPIPEGKRNYYCLAYAGILCKAGVKKELALKYLESKIPDFDVAQRIDYAYQNNDFGCERYRYGKKK